MVIIDDNATTITSSSTFTAGPLAETIGDGMFKLDGQHRPGGQMKRRHSVDFKPKAVNQVQELKDNSSTLDEETRILCWYSRDEYDIIKARNSLIVKMMKTGHFRESNEHSFRGLEHKLKEGFRQRRANKFNSLNAVLEEQDRQIAVGVKEPEIIAKKYRRVSLNAAETAFVVGIRDAEESLSYRPPSQSGSEDNVSDMTPSLPGDGDSLGEDTIPTEDSTTNAIQKDQVRGLFAAASILKKNRGQMSRRSSL